MALKGIALTLDAVIALLIMVSIISLLTFFRTESTSPFFMSQQLHSLSEDVLTILSESTLREIANQTLLNTYKQIGLLNESDFDKKAIDVIGALWAANRTEAANISKDILNDIIPNNMGYQVLINGANVYNSSDTLRPSYDDATTEISSSRIASGYEFNKPVTGFVARAWASKIRRNVTKIIPVNLEWGQYNDSNYWGNGYAPQGERSGTAILRKNFTIPSDATIFSQYLQLSLNSNRVRVKINGNFVYQGSDSIKEIDLKNNITSGVNQFEMIFNNTGGDLAHFHPGTYIKIKYNTSEVESGSNKTLFYSDWIQGSPAASEIIPFFVNAPIRNVTAFVDIQNINAFLLLTLNYRYNASNPLQNVLLYREYPEPVDCSQFSTQANCQSHPQDCSWNPTALVNITTFHATFDGWSTATNCGNALAEGWSDCIMSDPDGGVWRGSPGGSALNSSSTRKLRGSDIDNGGSAYATKCLDLSSYSKAYLKFDWSITGLDSGEYILIRVNKTGSPTLSDLWNSGTGTVAWSNKEINVTNNISSNTCFRVYCWAASLSSEYCDLDDFKIIGTKTGKCENIGSEDIKNRTYEINLNETGTLIKEYNSTGNLLNTWFNTNVTLNNVHSDMTNTLGIYADIRAPNVTPPGTIVPGGDGDVDWQRLGMYAHNGTAGHGNDHYCFITDKTNVTVYHDSEQYGLEYGKVDINAIENFTDALVCCQSKKGSNCYSSGPPISDNRTCRDTIINLTFPFSTKIIISRVIGTESLGGNDNGYNWVWMWNDSSPTNETNIVLDTDTPPGTFTYLPVKFFQLGRNNIIRVGDKDNGRYLNVDPTSLMGNKRSIVEYTFLIPSQVGYGAVFENQINATENATARLDDILGKYSTSADIMTENYTVSNVPYMWGPANIKVRVWI
jgi:hypothetical protein